MQTDDISSNSIMYYSGYIAYKMKNNIQFENCENATIDVDNILDMPNEYFIGFKSYNSATFSGLKCPTNTFFSFCSTQIEVFKRFFKLNIYKDSIKQHLVCKAIEETNIKFLEWFSGECREHEIQILDFLMLVLIRKTCHWLSAEIRESKVSKNRMQVLRQ